MSATDDAAAARRERHQQQLELERERQRTAQVKARSRHQASKSPVLQRGSVGRASSNEKMLGDAVTTAGVGAGTALWSATRPGAQAFFWSLGFMVLGTITMVESKPGTVLESGAAGTLGANTAVFVFELLNMIK